MYATPVSPIIGKTLKITQLEMLNVVVALRLWATEWAHSAVKLFCDNLAVVQVGQTGKTRDSFLAACIRNIWLLMATYDIDLQVQHIAGSQNEAADLLSRIYLDKRINNSLFSTCRTITNVGEYLSNILTFYFIYNFRVILCFTETPEGSLVSDRGGLQSLHQNSSCHPL